MSHTPHELASDFPEFTDQLHRLKMNDPHFKKLVDSYHKINRTVHRAETNIDPTTDENLSNMRKERMLLKDKIYGLLNAAADG